MVKETCEGNNKYHKHVTWIQFPIQLAITRIIDHSQGLSLSKMAFDLTNVVKHNLTYTIIYHIWTKEKLYLLAPLQHKNFHVDEYVS